MGLRHHINELDGRALTLAPSGWTYRQTFVLYDKETESLWYPFPNGKGLTGITGEYKGRFLPELASTTAAWKDWHREHPDTKFLRYEEAGAADSRPRGARGFPSQKDVFRR